MTGCCGPKCLKASVFIGAIILVSLGLVLVIAWQSIFDNILSNELSLKDKNTQSYGYWKETPIPMYLTMYLFNWTNVNEVVNSNWTVKPKLVECGPYTFHEHHTRENVVFNDNDTISYQTKRVWQYCPDKSKGSLDDKITAINTIAATVAFFIRNKHYLVRRGVNFFFEEKQVKLTVTKTAGELLFDGYDDQLLDLANKLHIKNFDIPFDKFGWFYTRNGSITYDGNYTMYTGADDIRKLGIFTLWNGEPRTAIYEGYCGMVNGTSGELWYPPKEDSTISVFSPDVCSTITLSRNGTISKYGVEGYKYTVGNKVFDNGENYPDMACFSPGEVLPRGVRNISQCKFNAPAFVSHPHFYLADPSYAKNVDGMHPDLKNQEFFMSLEPNTGLPLAVQAALQVNINLKIIPGIDLFSNIKPMMMPVMWFKQSAEISEELVSLAKLMVVMPAVGTYTGYGCILIGGLLLAIGTFITYRSSWRYKEEEEVLTENQL